MMDSDCVIHFSLFCRIFNGTASGLGAASARRASVRSGGRRPEAALLYSGLLSGPKRVNALQSLGKISFENGDLQAAQHFLGAALELAPDHLESLHLRGVALMRLGDTRGALHCLERAVAWPPD